MFLVKGVLALILAMVQVYRVFTFQQCPMVKSFGNRHFNFFNKKGAKVLLMGSEYNDFRKSFNDGSIVGETVYSSGNRLEDSPALVLNADYTPLSHIPLSIWYWQDALRAVISGKAVAVCVYNRKVRSVSTEFSLPSVIALKEYQRIVAASPPLTRRNVYLRDGCRCQYCLKAFSPDQLTLDHVTPRSKGGKLTWLNTVTACKDCNVRKSDYLIEDLPKLGMRLRSSPKAPTFYELQTRARAFLPRKLHPDWKYYVEF